MFEKLFMPRQTKHHSFNQIHFGNGLRFQVSVRLVLKKTEGQLAIVWQ